MDKLGQLSHVCRLFVSRILASNHLSCFMSQPNRKIKNGPKIASSRPPVTSVKVRRVKGAKGMREQHDLVINIDLERWPLSKEYLADLKEVFMLFDKDEDGVLSFSELEVVMKCLGQRPSEQELLAMVREVSQDKLYDTVEFNEFLIMIAKQKKLDITLEDLIEAFRIFDKEETGKISNEDFCKIMHRFGNEIINEELLDMVAEADSRQDGSIDYKWFSQYLIGKEQSRKKRTKQQRNLQT